MSTTVHRRFLHGDAHAREIQQTLDELMVELRDPNSDASSAATEDGFDPNAITDATVRVDEEQQGAEPVSTTILIGITASLGAEIIMRLWDHILWPRLRRRLGAFALGEEIDE